MSCKKPTFGQHKGGGACGTDQRIVLTVFAQQSLCVANVFAAEGFDQLRRLLCAQGRYHRRICTAQIAFWQRHLDTRRFGAALRVMFSVTALRAIYSSPLLRCLPPRLAMVMRGRLERGFANHPNRHNLYARALLLGELAAPAPVSVADRITLVHADAAEWLENAPAGSLDGFSLSNILDGANDAYRARLGAAVRRAAAPGAMVVLRSFSEPNAAMTSNCATADRSMLWGIVDVRPADQFD